MWTLILSNLVPIGIGAGLLVAVVWVRRYGKSQYKKGVDDTEATYRKADREGAENARETAENVNRKSDATDTDELLNSTNGFRD